VLERRAKQAMFATLDNFKTKKFHVKFIPSGKPRGQSNGGLPRGRGAALPLGQARGSYPGRSQKIDLDFVNSESLLVLYGHYL